MQQVAGVRRCQSARFDLGLTLRELAERCAAEGLPVNWSTLARIERGETVPRPQLRAVLAKILGLPQTAFDRGAP